MSNKREDISIPVIIPKLELLEIQRELRMGYAMMFHKALLGIAPEALQPVDVNPTPGEVCAVIDPQVSIATEHQGVIDPEAVGVYDAAPTDLFDREAEHRLCLDVGDHLDGDPSLPLQDTENRDFSCCTATSFALPSPSKVSLVEFDFASEEHISIRGMGQDGGSDGIDGLQGRIIAQAHLVSDLACRELQFEELDNAEPLIGSECSAVEPAAAEVMKGIAATWTFSPPVF